MSDTNKKVDDYNKIVKEIKDSLIIIDKAPINQSLEIIEILGNLCNDFKKEFDSTDLEDQKILLKSKHKELTRKLSILNLKKIPDELKKNKAWVVMKFEKDKIGNYIINKSGKKSKMPYQINGFKAKSNDSQSWNFFENCSNSMKLNKEIKGLGFMLSYDDNYLIIDIDNIDINNTDDINESKQEKINFLKKYNSYLELSQSRRGFHMIFKLKDKKEFEKYAKEINLINYSNETKKTLSSKHGDYEVYLEKRCMWLTGNVCHNKSKIREITFEEAKNIFEFIESKSKKNQKPVLTNQTKISDIHKTVAKSDNEIIDIISRSRQKEKFLNLYNEFGQDGNSEGDQEISNILAFYTKDKEQIIRILKNSSRYRKKFDRSDYLDRTVSKALELTRNNYYGNFDNKKNIKKNNFDNIKNNKFETIIQSNHKKWIEQIKKQGAIIPDTIKRLDWIVHEVQSNKLKFKINTGILAEFLRNKLKYIFIRNSADEGIDKYVYDDKKGVYCLVTDNDFKFYIKKHIPLNLRVSKHLNEVLDELYTDNKFIDFNLLNPEKYINFQNGLFNIKTWKLEKHDPEILSTIQLPIKYKEKVTKPKHCWFDKYLNYLVKDNEDVKKLILQFMGITLSNIPGYLMKKAMFMVGVHNTGKSKIKELMILLLGNINADTLDFKELESRFGAGYIMQKRLIGSNDESYIRVPELKIFKRLTAGDTTRTEKKFKGGTNSKFKGIIWLCTNENPRFGGDRGEGVYNRIILVECNDRPMPEKEQEPKLLEYLYKEKEYIINIALNGLKQVIQNNYKYNIPQTCIDALEEYKIENDSFLRFLDECTEKVDSGKIKKEITKSIIFKIYKAWCKDNNNGYFDSKKDIKNKLEQKKINEIKKVDGIIYYTDFTLTEEVKKEYKDYILF